MASCSAYFVGCEVEIPYKHFVEVPAVMGVVVVIITVGAVVSRRLLLGFMDFCNDNPVCHSSELGD